MSKSTPKYLFLHRSEARAKPAGATEASPEQMQAMFAKWSAWKEKFKDRVVDWGTS